MGLTPLDYVLLLHCYTIIHKVCSKSKISLTWDCTQPTDVSEAKLQYTVHFTPGHKLMYLHIQNHIFIITIPSLSKVDKCDT